MEEQFTTPRPAARPSRTVPLLVLIVLIAAAVVGSYVLIIKREAAIDPVSYIPQEVAIAASIDLTETPEKLDAYNFINGLFKEAGKTDALDSMFEELGKNLKLDFKKDVAAHLSGRAAAAVLDEMAGTMPKIVAVIGAKSTADADAIMTTLGNKLNAEKVAFTRASYGKVNYYNIPTPEIVSYVGAVNSTVVWASSETAFRTVVDTANGKPSLLSDNHYATLRKSGPKTFATTYFSGPNIYKLLEPLFGLAAMQAPPGSIPPGSLDGIKENLQSVLAVVTTAEASGDGIKCSTSVASSQKQASGKAVSVDEMVAGVPKDAAVVLSLGDFAGAWASAVVAMDKQPRKKAQFDQMVQQLKMMSGIDLRADVLDRVKSMKAYYVPSPVLTIPATKSGPASFPGAIDMVLQVDQPEAMAKTVEKLHAIAGMLGGMPFKPATIDGQSAFVAPLGPGGETLTDAIVGDKLLIHIGGKGATMPTAIAQLKSPGAGVNTSEAFKLVKSQLAPDSHMLFYGDVGAIVRMFSDSMPAKDRKAAESITRKIGAFGISAVPGQDQDELQVVIPFSK